MLQRKQPHPVVGIRLAVCCRLLAVWVGLASVSPADEPQRPPGSGSSGAAVSPAETESHPSANKRPNIVLLVADDIGYGELGCQGNEQIPTPHIDSLARQGVRFTNGYVTAAYCSASRAGLLTGRYQTRFGHEFNPTGARNEEALAGLPVDQRTLGQHLQQAGYATLLIGKWHLGAAAQYHPLRRGFDEFYGFLHEGHFFAPSPYAGMTTMLRRRTLPDGSQGRWVNQDSTLVLSTHMGHSEPAYDANNPILRDGQPVEEREYLTDAWTREALEAISRHRDRPFFLYLAYNAAHSPLQAPTATLKKFQGIEDIHRRIFAGMVSHLDDSVGAILQRLQEERLEQQTLVIFLSDNGGATRELTSSNHPLRGEKGHLYEGGIRVPFLMRWPDRIPAGMVYHEPVISLDLFATVAAAAETSIPQNLSLDGVNLLPYLQGELASPPHEALFWRTGPKAALRQGNWKLVREPARNQPATWELFDLSQDIGEQTDLAARHPEKLEALEKLWSSYNAEMVPPIWRPR